MARKIITFIALFLSLAIWSFVSAQDAIIIIQGKVVDNQQAPLPFASISVSSGRIGIQTNAAGLFILRIEESRMQDSLVISHVGYEVRKIAVAAFLAERSALVIKLKEKPVDMKEVVVSNINAAQLIELAIAKIPRNYYNTPHTITGFYRVDTKRDADFIQISEAVFDVYHHGIGRGKESLLKLKKMRRIKDEKSSRGIDFGMTSKAVLEFDIVNTINSSDIFNATHLKQYAFHLEGITEYNGLAAYEISFDQKDGLKKSLYKGKIYLDKESLAFTSLQLSRSPKGMRYAKYASAGTRAMMTILGIRMNLKGEGYKVDYKKFGSKWTLSSAQNTVTLGLKSHREHYEFDAKMNVNCVITEIDTIKQVPFKEEEVLGGGKFIEFQNSEPDSGFWKDYNILLADYNVGKVIRHIRAKNNALNLKKQIEKILSKLPKDPVLRIDSILSFYHTRGDFNGNAMVRSEEKVLLSNQYGFANKERKIPLSENSAFRIGSLTKSFTALLMQQLCSEGKLQLSDTIGKFLPEYVHKNVTLEQLLTHTSGIPNFTSNNDYLAEVMTRSRSLKEIVLNYCSGALEFKSGQGFQYSNSGYVVLAAVIETVTARSYRQVLKNKILEPLKMEQTDFGQDTINTTGYLYDEPEPAYKVAGMAGAGGMSSTLKDLAKWDKALSDSILIARDKVDSMFTPRAEYADWNAFYGYGWMIDRDGFESSKKHRIIYHPGTDLGYYTMFVRQPDKNILVVLLNNTGDFARFDMVDLILEELNR